MCVASEFWGVLLCRLCVCVMCVVWCVIHDSRLRLMLRFEVCAVWGVVCVRA